LGNKYILEKFVMGIFPSNTILCPTRSLFLLDLNIPKDHLFLNRFKLAFLSFAILGHNHNFIFFVPFWYMLSG